MDAPPQITSPDTQIFTVGTNSSFRVTTTGLPVPALSENGGLPGGLTFVDNGDGTAMLSGAPALGSNPSYPLAITARNGVAPDATQSFTLVVNRPPVASDVSLGTSQNVAVQVRMATLLAHASDPDGDPLTVVSVDAKSARGGAVGLSAPGSAGTVTYTPAVDFTGTDTFTFVVSDGRGGLAKGTVPVAVPVGNPLKELSLNRTASTVTVLYAGAPNAVYQPQYADGAGGPWIDAGPAVSAADDGQFTSVDSTRPQPTRRFYRAKTVP